MYDLVGLIEHHGATLSSGHYTSKLFYTDAAYNCDDHNISKFNNSIVLNSKLAYVVFYAKNRWLDWSNGDRSNLQMLLCPRHRSIGFRAKGAKSWPVFSTEDSLICPFLYSTDSILVFLSGFLLCYLHFHMTGTPMDNASRIVIFCTYH